MNEGGKSAGGAPPRRRAPRPPRRQPAPPARFDPRIRGTGTRERLIQATLELLAKGGLPAATSRAITAKSEANLQAITYHFGSKDELVAEALLRAFRTWIEPARTVLRSDQDPVTKMVGAVQALQASFERARPILPVYLEALVQAPKKQRLRNGVRKLLRELHTLLVEQIAELRNTGFLPAWIEPDAMATLLLSTADGLALHAALDPKAVDHHAAAAQVTQLLLAARAAPTPP
jgi:AcrR family transcriptional regulator